MEPETIDVNDEMLAKSGLRVLFIGQVKSRTLAFLDADESRSETGIRFLNTDRALKQR